MLKLSGVWKFFGPPRSVRLALKKLTAEPDLDKVHRDIGVVPAVAAVDLEVRRREILVIVGMSGSGKSTLIRHMNGLIKPSLGTVSVDGRPIDNLPRRKLQELRANQVGMVFQSTSLFVNRSVIDNVAFGLEIKRMPRETRYKVAMEWLDRVKLADCAHRSPAELSGGMQQRVGLARTLATDPETLLLDEPFSALDPIIRRSLQDQFVALVRELGKTAVFITHDFAEAARIADRIGVMAAGRLIQLGTPREIVESPASPYVRELARRDVQAHYSCAGDVARQKADLAVCVQEPAVIPAYMPLAEIVRRLQIDDACLRVEAEGQVIGWIDRSVLLGHIGKMFGSPHL